MFVISHKITGLWGDYQQDADAPKINQASGQNESNTATEKTVPTEAYGQTQGLMQLITNTKTVLITTYL